MKKNTFFTNKKFKITDKGHFLIPNKLFPGQFIFGNGRITKRTEREEGFFYGVRIQTFHFMQRPWFRRLWPACQWETPDGEPHPFPLFREIPPYYNNKKWVAKHIKGKEIGVPEWFIFKDPREAQAAGWRLAEVATEQKIWELFELCVMAGAHIHEQTPKQMVFTKTKAEFLKLIEDEWPFYRQRLEEMIEKLNMEENE